MALTKEERLAAMRVKYDAWHGPNNMDDIRDVSTLIAWVEICAWEACLDQQDPDIEEEACWEIAKQTAWQLWREGHARRVLATELLRSYLSLTPKEAGIT